MLLKQMQVTEQFLAYVQLIIILIIHTEAAME